MNIENENQDEKQSGMKRANIIALCGVMISLIALLFGDSIFFRMRSVKCVIESPAYEPTVEALTPTYPEVTIQATEPPKPVHSVKRGEIIRLGRYEQDNNIGNDQEAIDWIVLEINGNDALLISRYALDTKPYHAQKVEISWENCSLRSWLNSVFLNASFTQSERAAIKPVTNAASRNPRYSTDPGNKTEDKVFLLSIDEVIQYMPQNIDRLCQATLYAVGQGAYVNTATAGSWWWLRTPGNSSKDASSVNSDGSIDYDDGSVNSSKGTVRPAMWVDVSMLG